MALTLQFFIGRLLNRNEKVTTAKLNAMVKGMSANLSGTVGTANIDDAAITTAKVQQGAYFYATAILGGSTYTAAYTPAVAGYADGLILAFKADAANPGAANLDAGAGAKPIKKLGGTALIANDILAGQIVEVRYNSTMGAGSFEMINPPQNPDGRFLIGQIVLTGRTAAPTGWLLCDGTSYLRTDYPDLFTALGAAASPWGLPDGTHFNVPDLRGQFVRGWSTDASVDPSGPRAPANVQTDQIKNHLHLIANTDTTAANPGTTLTNANQLAVINNAGGADGADYTLAGTGTAATVGKTSNPTAGAGTETRPGNVAAIYIIKV